MQQQAPPSLRSFLRPFFPSKATFQRLGSQLTCEGFPDCCRSLLSLAPRTASPAPVRGVCQIPAALIIGNSPVLQSGFEVSCSPARWPLIERPALTVHRWGSGGGVLRRSSPIQSSVDVTEASSAENPPHYRSLCWEGGCAGKSLLRLLLFAK